MPGAAILAHLTECRQTWQHVIANNCVSPLK